MNNTFKISGILLSSLILFRCGNSNQSKSTENNKTEISKPAISTPDFNAGNAYKDIETQLSFGTRVPGSKGHKACGDWIVQEMKALGLEIIEQSFDSYSYKGQKRPARNIIASYNPTASKRVILAAHWDTREIADQDDERKDEPIPGANDAASGVAILMQMAKSISQATQKPAIGIDFIFFDAEDGGAPESFQGKGVNDYGGYCQGSEYWSKNPHKENYSAFYGILLDMAGAKNATFLKEQYSMEVAPSIVNKIWNTAATKGFSGIFVNKNGPGITDDHRPVIINRKIPMVDIIDLKPYGNQTFFDHWHTHGDGLEVIDQTVLEAVGETLLQVLYEEGGIAS